MIECRECEGTGEIVVGWRDGSYLNPPQPRVAICPDCKGDARARCCIKRPIRCVRLAVVEDDGDPLCLECLDELVRREARAAP